MQRARDCASHERAQIRSDQIPFDPALSCAARSPVFRMATYYRMQILARNKNMNNNGQLHNNKARFGAQTSTLESLQPPASSSFTWLARLIARTAISVHPDPFRLLLVRSSTARVNFGGARRLRAKCLKSDYYNIQTCRSLSLSLNAPLRLDAAISLAVSGAFVDRSVPERPEITALYRIGRGGLLAGRRLGESIWRGKRRYIAAYLQLVLAPSASTKFN